MDRHITDKPRTRTAAPRLREFLRLEREQGRHPAVDALHRKAHDRSGRKTAEFSRIERQGQD